MSLAGVMTENIVTISVDDSLGRVKSTFEENEFHHLLVVEQSKLVGVISDRDLLKAISPNLDTAAETQKDTATLNKRVHQIMTRKLITLTEEKSLYDAIDLFNEHKISCIPIIDSNKKPVGILSWRDIFKAIGNRRHKKVE